MATVDRAMTQEEMKAAEKVRGTGAEFITADQLAARLESGRPPIVVDVLPADSYRESHIKGAINIPSTEIRELAPRVLADREAEIVVYCGSFDCTASMDASKALKQLGYLHVFDFKGGLKQWAERGLPLEGREAGRG